MYAVMISLHVLPHTADVYGADEMVIEQSCAQLYLITIAPYM